MTSIKTKKLVLSFYNYFVIKKIMLILNTCSFLLVYSVTDVFLNEDGFIVESVESPLFWTKLSAKYALREKCPNTEFFVQIRSVQSISVYTEYGVHTRSVQIRSISPYSVRMRENTDQKNSVFGHFSCGDNFLGIYEIFNVTTSKYLDCQVWFQ